MKSKTRSMDVRERPTNSVGVDYPIDVWFILSEYIAPEDVGRFAAICKTSYEVVCTANFWFNLHKRYYRRSSGLPDYLRPEHIFRKHGLRASVIRSLFFVYQPFIERVRFTHVSEKHPEILKNYQCVLSWYQGEKGRWEYYFKMKKNENRLRERPIKNRSSKPDLLKILDDITVNPDEMCKVLRVNCRDYVQVPPVIGLSLQSVSVTLSRGFRNYRLQLNFGSSVISTLSVPYDSSSVVVLDPVVNINVLDWWHPLYPYSHAVKHVPIQDS